MRKECTIKALNYDKEIEATIFVELKGECLCWHGYGTSEDNWEEEEVFATDHGNLSLKSVSAANYNYEIEGLGEFKVELKWCDSSESEKDIDLSSMGQQIDF
ncbi:hypothetical protein [Halanaerobium hydrogeniformans]|uniref:Uncharacterized protein n=1 Tax=Halanaerobium hydrogeniformans TaxID=656519 RepID=E4RM37_HALHG|nr:hypothetical protein [Halanaerobium hydrogeniformans]ADQ14120.1 hypothetical protein Halsa_0669 [Halanaerobium hydrogeniformans]